MPNPRHLVVPGLAVGRAVDSGLDLIAQRAMAAAAEMGLRCGTCPHRDIVAFACAPIVVAKEANLVDALLVSQAALAHRS